MSKLRNIIAGLIIAALSCIGTMFYIVGKPVDEHIVIQNRALNYFDKTIFRALKNMPKNVKIEVCQQISDKKNESFIVLFLTIKIKPIPRNN